MDDEFLKKFSLLVWKYVHTFCDRTKGYRSNLLVDRHDLYQECMLKLFERYKKSGLSIEEFSFNHMDLNHYMCCYVLSNLPVRVPIRTDHYSQRIRQYAFKEPVKGLSSYTEPDNYDPDFMVDYTYFVASLSEDDLNILNLLLSDKSGTEITEELGITREALRWKQRKLARAWNAFRDENRLYYGRKA